MSSTLSAEREALYLGALLHDVGKFRQRANAGEKFEKHQMLSTAAVEQLFGNETINAIVANHHKEDLAKSNLTGRLRLLAEIVCEADNLASGERTGDGAVVKQELLRSIFSVVSLSEERPPQQHWQPLAHLTPNAYQMPINSTPAEKELQGRYQTHWQEFSNELATIQSAEAQTLTALYKKYLWCMPSSSYKTLPDISLYEHSRLTAALALCLYDALGVATAKDGDAQGIISRVGKREDMRYRLVCGDITGIQNYIYGIAHKKALKSLKGRSFFLQHLCTSIAEHYVGAFSLPSANIIYASGGKFYLLLPETPESDERLRSLRADIQQRFLRQYEGALGFVAASVRLCGKDFLSPINPGGEKKQSPAIVKAWDKVGQALEREKQRPFAALVSHASFFETFGVGGNVVRCYATGKELCTAEEVSSKLDDEVFPYDAGATQSAEQSEKKYISREQYDAQRIGEKLRQADVLCVSPASGDGMDALGLGMFALSDNRADIRANANSALYLLNNDDFLSLTSNAQRGWRFYGGNWTFESDLDELEEKAFGIKRLGMLRMDVDNLGRIFAEGLGDTATFSRVVQLSSMLDFFFSSYLNKLQTLRWNIRDGINAKEGDPLSDLMSIVYAGGDDVCIIGVWNVLPDVALWIDEEFRRYVGNNRNFSLSAGIALFSGKFPIVKASALAGEAEHRAKGKRRAKDGGAPSKNALCLFGKPMSWEDTRVVRKWAANLATWILDGQGNSAHEQPQRLNRGIVQRLHRIYAEYEAGKGEQWAQWRWRATYSLARFGEQHKHFQRHIADFAADLMAGDTSAVKTEQDFIALTDVIATWTEYLTRSE